MAAYFDADNYSKTTAIYNDLRSHNPEIKLLYVTPEKVSKRY